MGFLSQFSSQPQQSAGDVISQARQLAEANGGADAALRHLAESGMTCTLPSGKVMSVKEILDMGKGKTTRQLISELLKA